MLLFSVLGCVEIKKNRSAVRLGGAMQQTLLATLLVSGGDLVTVDSLIAELWGTTPPAKVENALQAQISRIRRTLAALEPGRDTSRVVTSTSGYLFTVGRWELDATLFLDAVEAIHARAGHGAHACGEKDITELRDALSHWRGPMFGGLAGGLVCQTAAARYLEARTSALTLLYDLELRAGGHERILPELAELYFRNPVHEQFCMLLMRALYRCGRQLDALGVYRQCRRNLIESQGVEPSPALSQYEQAILTHDPRLLQDEPYWPVPDLVAP
ncbi:BTAD domain-containing putative transcriptional regulator [Streptomyces sp. NPDC048567]|uniref:AfsR/SARP family transcriptional regulator n=1 Tax=Streptomyces sp. NPDC048567 TaxID=3365570 RepID=UPI00371D7F24